MERISRTARRTAKTLEQENEILQGKERPPSVHEGEASEMGEWEGPGIPREEFNGVRKARTEG